MRFEHSKASAYAPTPVYNPSVAYVVLQSVQIFAGGRGEQYTHLLGSGHRIRTSYVVCYWLT